MGDPFESAPKGLGGLAGGLGSRSKISPRGLGLCQPTTPRLFRIHKCLELRLHNYSTMTLRRVAIVTSVAVLAFVGLLAILSAWMGALSVGVPMWEDLTITDVQFSENLVTVTVKNQGRGGCDVTITEVMVSDEVRVSDSNHTLLNKVPMSIPIQMGEQHSISVGCEWISCEAYQVRLTSARGNNWAFRYAVAP